MNIAIINSMAKTTSTGKIAYGLHKYLKSQGHQSRVFYGRKDPTAEGDADLIRFCSELEFRINAGLVRLLGAEGCYAKYATKRLLKQLDGFQPDAVYLLNLHAYYLNLPMLFKYLGSHNIKVAYLMLDEAPFLGKCCFSFSCEKYKTECNCCPQKNGYPKSVFFDRAKKLFNMKKVAYAQVEDITFVGIQYTLERAKESALLREAKLVELDEAVDLRGTYYPRCTEQLRERLGIPKENLIVLTVAPFSNPRKGGKFFVKAAEILVERKDITFVHVGFNGDTSICPPNYIPITYVSDQNELAEYYSLADLFVCTSLAETVANTCLEALSCGTPLLSFNVSGMPYAADEEHGTFVNAGCAEELADVIAHTERKTEERIASCRKYAESRYDSVHYFKKLADILCK